ncbi:MAG: pyruvate kinase [Planctomycetes bacterium]|nr:pyruvate kinase [Planctomycetota bacterium]
MTRTRIVATLGPATASEEAIAALIGAGVDVFRLNFSHGTHEDHGAAIGRIRRLAGDRPVAILQDLCGPKFRLDRPLRARAGEIVEIPLPGGVRPGDPVLLADGTVHLEVVDGMRCRVVIGGDLPAGKGINFPSSRLDVPALTDKDRRDLAFGVAQGVDFVALSFVRRASDLDEVKRSGLPVVAKIEKPEAVENMEEIVRAADGIMVARGDLGVEIPIERVPVVQKRLIALANRAGKPVITATQMLRSMVDEPMPTRAEATDVANAVLDGTDAVMLSEETAIGKYAVESVRVMDRIIAEAEPLLAPRSDDPGRDPEDVLSAAACEMAERIGARAIVVPTQSGFTARKVARRRPRVPIIALTPEEKTRLRLSLVWGVAAVTVPWFGDHAGVLEQFREPVRATRLVPDGSRVVVTAGWPFATPGITNLVHVTTL